MIGSFWLYEASLTRSLADGIFRIRTLDFSGDLIGICSVWLTETMPRISPEESMLALVIVCLGRTWSRGVVGPTAERHGGRDFLLVL